MSKYMLKYFTKDREVVLTGEREHCEKFYHLYGEELGSVEVPYVIPDELNQVMNDKFAIVCTKDSYNKKMDDLLYSLGRFYEDDYMDARYYMHSRRVQSKIDICLKKIWIYGAGIAAKIFYEQHKETLEVCGFISNFQEEQEYLGLPVIRPEELKEKENVYVVVCSLAWNEMAEKLRSMGYVPFEDYTFPEFLPRKFFVCMGNCSIGNIADTLQFNRKFKGIWEIWTVFENEWLHANYADRRRMILYGKFADAVLWQKRVTEFMGGELDYGYIVKQYYKDARSFGLPTYFFNGQLMQIERKLSPYMLNFRSGAALWGRGDSIINEMVEKKYSLEEIIDTILYKECWAEDEIRKNWGKAINILRFLDKYSAIPIKNYVEQNYQTELLFTDGVHLGIGLRVFMADELAEKLGIEKLTEKEKEELVNKRKGTTFFVYPCVRKALKICNEQSLLFYCGVERKEYISIEEMIRRYVRYIQETRDILNESGCM